MKLECTVCSMIYDSVKLYVLDLKKFASPEFKTERHNLHFFYSLILTFFSIWFMFLFMNLEGTGILFQIFVGGFGAYGVNFIREWYYGVIYDAPWSSSDINFGSYGGVVGTILFLLFNHFIIG
jgi:hypothetical protein